MLGIQREIRALKFSKRFEGKIRYITKQSGLLGALFTEFTESENNKNMLN